MRRRMIPPLPAPGRVPGAPGPAGWTILLAFPPPPRTRGDVMSSDRKLFIDGTWRVSGRTQPVVSPYDGPEGARVHPGGGQEVEDGTQAAGPALQEVRRRC